MSRTLFERAERSIVESISCRGRVHGQSGHAADRADRPRMTHMRHGAVSEAKLSPLTAIVSE
jgi:hypothetical protein